MTSKERSRSAKKRQVGIASTTVRAQYLSSDRLRCGSSAGTWYARCNKRLARFLGVRPRLVWLFKWQKRARIESWCDTDHAGCILKRKSVSGCALMLGDGTVCTYCKGQAVIVLSSGEAECYGLVSATSQMLGLQSIHGCHSWKCDWRTRSNGH